MLKKLHKGAIWFFRVNALFRSLFLFFFLGFFLYAWTNKTIELNSLLKPIIYLLIIYVILIEIYSRMAYNRFFYEFSENQLIIEKGIIWKRYSNIPYQRIQNIDITRGIIARFFGFSTILIQTAGYSGAHNNNFFAEGYIPAVSFDEAEKIRKFVIKKIQKNSKKVL